MGMILSVGVERGEDLFERRSLFLHCLYIARCVIPRMVGTKAYLYSIWWVIGRFVTTLTITCLHNFGNFVPSKVASIYIGIMEFGTEYPALEGVN